MTGGARATVALVLRLALAGVLLAAGVLKLGSPADLAAEITNYRLWPAAAPYLGATLPTIEVVVGISLVALPLVWRRAAALAAAALFAAFAFAVTSAYARGIDVACGCFGAGGDPISALTLARNGALLAGALALVVLQGRSTGRGQPANKLATMSSPSRDSMR